MPIIWEFGFQFLTVRVIAPSPADGSRIGILSGSGGGYVFRRSSVHHAGVG
jgi:hypothetical protein